MLVFILPRQWSIIQYLRHLLLKLCNASVTSHEVVALQEEPSVVMKLTYGKDGALKEEAPATPVDEDAIVTDNLAVRS